MLPRKRRRAQLNSPSSPVHCILSHCPTVCDSHTAPTSTNACSCAASRNVKLSRRGKSRGCRPPPATSRTTSRALRLLSHHRANLSRHSCSRSAVEVAGTTMVSSSSHSRILLSRASQSSIELQADAASCFFSSSLSTLRFKQTPSFHQPHRTSPSTYSLPSLLSRRPTHHSLCRRYRVHTCAPGSCRLTKDRC